MTSEDDKMIHNKSEIPAIFLSLISLVRFIWQRWVLFLIIGIIGGLAGIWYASNQPTEYKSHLTFALDDGENGSSMGNLLGLASQFGLNIGNSKDIFSGDNILEIMKSRRMIEKVLLSVDTFHNRPYTLIDYYLYKCSGSKKPAKPNDIHFPPGITKASFTYQQDSLLYKIYKEFADHRVMAGRPDRKLSIFEVNVSSPDEKFTKYFTDRLVTETNNFYVEIRTKKAKGTLSILEKRVGTMRGNMNSSIADKAIVQDVNINPAFSEAQVPVQKQQANIQVFGSAYGEMFKNLEIARFQYLNEIPLMQIIDPADFPMQKIKSSKLKMAILFALFAGLLALSILGLRNLFSHSRDPI